jgi:hypothetical protein
MAGVALAVGLLGLWGCGSSEPTFSIVSTKDGLEVAPAFHTAVFTNSDQNTVDVLLTDLPVERLLNPADPMADVSGSIVHVHLFLMPKAGRTPIDDTACNSTVRHMIVAQGALGLYGGGGFLFPNSDADGATFSATLEDASLRLIRRGPGFADRLGGPARASGAFTAQRDDALAKALQGRFGRLSDALTDVSGK